MFDPEEVNQEEYNRLLGEYREISDKEDLISRIKHDVISSAGSIQTSALFLEMLVDENVALKPEARASLEDLKETISGIIVNAERLMAIARAAADHHKQTRDDHDPNTQE